MKTTTKKSIICFVLMLCFILYALLFSFEFAMYGDDDYSFYRKEYEKYNVTDALNMDIDSVMKVTDYMMDYLIGDEETLSIETNVDGKTQDFFNDKDREHMADVQTLFLNGLKLKDLLGALVVFGLLFMFAKRDTTLEFLETVIKSYSGALILFLVLCAGLGIWCFVNFTAFFTVFHHIFFTGNSWLFNPDTDYMIRMLPEGFFMDFVMKILMIFLATLLIVEVFLFAFRALLKRNERTNVSSKIKLGKR